VLNINSLILKFFIFSLETSLHVTLCDTRIMLEPKKDHYENLHFFPKTSLNVTLRVC